MAETNLINELPEDLLLKILLLMPTKDAIATTILSKQWKSLWKKLHTLKFNIEKEKINTFSLFLNKSLLQVNKLEDELQKLSIKIGEKCPRPADLDMEKYVEKAINRKVRKLELKLFWSADPMRLPKTLYTCNTLVKLSLSGNILLENLSSESSLPCLKTLKLYSVMYKDEDSVVNFLSSCPVLEVLILRRYDDNVKKFKVKVSSLREFVYFDYVAMAEDEDRYYNLVLDTPLLKRFLYLSFGGGGFCKIETLMPCLDDAFIEIFGYGFIDDKFLKSMPSLITLHIYLTCQMVPCCNTVELSRLTECKIIATYKGWLKPVMSLLANSPKLKKLSIRYEYKDLPVSWKQPSCVPECLWSHLEVFEFQYGGSEVEKQFITYIFGNSKCLETAKISFIFSLNFGEKQRIREDLKHIPRVSTTSHLLFQ